MNEQQELFPCNSLCHAGARFSRVMLRTGETVVCFAHHSHTCARLACRRELLDADVPAGQVGDQFKLAAQRAN